MVPEAYDVAKRSGQICSWCGCILPPPYGAARRCQVCEKRYQREAARQGGTSFRVTCPDCGTRVRRPGLADHRRDKHGIAA
jgi:hypothetical protein